jgi:hypothetical protein
MKFKNESWVEDAVDDTSYEHRNGGQIRSSIRSQHMAEAYGNQVKGKSIANDPPIVQSIFIYAFRCAEPEDDLWQKGQGNGHV